MTLGEYMEENIWKKLDLAPPFPRFKISRHVEYNARTMQNALRTNDGRLELCDVWAFDNPDDYEDARPVSPRDFVAVLADLISDSLKLLQSSNITKMFTPQLVPKSPSIHMLIELRSA